MKEIALKLAKEFDSQAEVNFDIVMTADVSPMDSQTLQFIVQCAKENQANAKLLRDMVAEINRLEEELSKKLV